MALPPHRAAQPDVRHARRALLGLLARVPVARVVTVETLAAGLGVTPQIVVTLLAGLDDDERARVPWHRVVAKGGAIGRGPHRDAQFARLVREGVPVSPAGIVQDMMRTALSEIPPPGRMVTAAEAAPQPPDQSPDQPPGRPPPLPLSRSRGMKDRPA